MDPRGGISEFGITSRKTIAGFAIKEFSQPPFRHLPWHEHQDASVCFVAGGSYTERARGQVRECAPRSMVFKPASEPHADQFGSQGGTCLLIEIGPARLETIEPYCNITTTPNLVRNPRLAALGHQIHREFTDSDQLTPLAVEGLMLEVLVEAARALPDRANSEQPAWLRRAHELIQDSFTEPLTLSSVARAVGVHPSHLARTFRKHYRWSIGDYVRRLRIERAARELSETRTSLAEIGLRSGFFDQSHFSRVFKRRTGLTPAAFRVATAERTSRTSPPQSS